MAIDDAVNEIPIGFHLEPDVFGYLPNDADDRIHREEDEQFERLLASLTGRERRVLQLLFGPEDGAARTLQEIGREYGVSRERIRQIKAEALRKLRHPSPSRLLREFAIEPPRPRDPDVQMLEEAAASLRGRAAEV